MSDRIPIGAQMTNIDPSIDPNFREFEMIMRATKTNQRKVSNLMRINVVTVNRWVKKDRPDALNVPYYALAFMRAYLMLSEPQRGKLEMMSAQGGEA